MLKRLSRIGLLFLIGITTGFTLLYFNQERILFFPSQLNSDFEFQFSTPHKESYLELEDGKNIHFLVFEAERPSGNLLYFHGNAGSLAYWGKVAAELSLKTNFSVWIMDYPGFGKSEGSLPKNEKVLLELGVGIHSLIKKQHPDRPLIFLGRSVGSGISTLVASIAKPDGIILETPYKSIAKLGHEIYPILPESFSRFDLDNERNLVHLAQLPTLILHGTKDRVIPFSHGESLAGIHSNVNLIALEDGGHNNLTQHPDYWPAIQEFLKRF